MASHRNISLTDLFNLYPKSPCVIVVKNISDKTSRDALENYLARILNVDVKEVHYPAAVNGCCVMVFYRPIRGLRKYRKALEEQPLDGHVLDLFSLGRCEGILVRNPPSDLSPIVFERFLKSEEFTGVTEEIVKDIEYLNSDTGRFVVMQIPDTAVISRILNRCKQPKCQNHNLEIDPHFPNLHHLQRGKGSYGISCLETENETACEQAGTAGSVDGAVMRKPVEPFKNEVCKDLARVNSSDDVRRSNSKPDLRNQPPKETGLSQSTNSFDSNAVKNQRPGFQSNGHGTVSKSTEEPLPEYNIERLRLQKLEQEAADEAMAKSLADQEQKKFLFNRHKSEPYRFRKHGPHSTEVKDRNSKTHHRTTPSGAQGAIPTCRNNVETNEENRTSWPSLLSLSISSGMFGKTGRKYSKVIQAAETCAENISEFVQAAKGKQKPAEQHKRKEPLAPNYDSNEETETFFQPLEKHENISDRAQAKIRTTLKKHHVKSNDIPGSKAFMLEGDKESVERAYEEILDILLTDDTEDEAGTNPETAARKEIVEYMALKDEPKVPEYWKHFNPGSPLTNALQTLNQHVKLFKKDHIRVELDSDDPVFKAIEKEIQSTWDKRKGGQGIAVLGLDVSENSRIRITRIHRIENLQLYEKYSRHRKRTFLKIHREGRKCCNSVERVPNSWGPVMTRGLAGCQVLRHELFPEINEYFFFHGTSRDAIDAICNTGLDFRVGSQNSLYGACIYAAESPTMADQYVDPQGERDRTMLLVRMFLGDSYLCSDQAYQYRRPTCANMKHLRDDCKTYSHGSFDSVIGQSRKFREFVVYEKDQCYPEYLITYTREQDGFFLDGFF